MQLTRGTAVSAICLSTLVVYSAWPGGAASGQSTAPFVDVTAQSGIDFLHVTGAAGQLLLPEVIGSGGALFDYDNDGDLDLFAVQSGVLGAARSGSGARDSGSGARDSGSGARGSGSGIRDSGSGTRDAGLGIRGSGGRMFRN